METLRVVTLSEAARHWQKHANTVRRARDMGRLEARRTPTGWLIGVASLRALWGDPRVPLPAFPDCEPLDFRRCTY